MYKILSDQNKVLGYVDTPSYIKLENGNITPLCTCTSHGSFFRRAGLQPVGP